MNDLDSLVSSAKIYHWFRDNGITDSVLSVQKHGLIVIKDPIRKSQWQEFESGLDYTNKSLIVITDGVPSHWIRNKKLKVIRRQNVLKKTLTSINNYLKNSNYDFKHFHRQVSSLNYDYFLQYGRWEHHRETVVAELESRQILTGSLYSRPTIGDRPGRSIEDYRKDAPIEFRFRHADNFKTVVENSQRCHCSIVLENNGLLAESDSTITEKSLWPILAQVPFVWAVAPNKVEQLTKWGFRPNDFPKTDLRALTEQLMWLRSEFANLDRAQKWQDDQGAIINHNLSILKGLSHRIDEETHQQMVSHGI